MRRSPITLVAVILTLSACADTVVTPVDETEPRPSYGVEVPSAYVNLGLSAPTPPRSGGPLLAPPTRGVSNGSFELNAGPGSTVLDDWTTFNDGDGAVFAQTGTFSPISGFPVPAPPDGAFASMTDQFGPGLHIWYQDVDVPANSELHFDLYLGNQAGVFFTPNTLSQFVFPNQQFRADIMDPDAPIDDVGAGVLANVYQTGVGDPPVSGYDHVVYDMSAFKNQTVRVRFAQVDNIFFFQAGVDDVFVGRGTGGHRVVHRTTGAGHTTTAGGDKRVFSFSAVELADGSVSGQFTLLITASILGSENPSITRAHAEVVCLAVEGNRAWVGGVVKNASNPDWIGRETGWAVEDNGEGEPSPDFISLMNVPSATPGLAQAVCDNKARVPSLPVEGGNVQVR